MDNYQTEDYEVENESNLQSFYSNNKVLVWVLVILLAIVLIGVIVMRNNNSSNGNASNLVFDNNYDTVMFGSSRKISASINDNTSYEVKYSSSDTSVITVDRYGLVEGVGLGSASLRAYYIDSNGKEYYIERIISVFDGSSGVELINASFPDGDVIIRLNDEYNLGTKISINPSNGYIYKKVFKSSNDSIVSVSESGKIVALREGEALINVNINDKFDSNIRVYVLENQTTTEIVKLPESIELSQLLLNIKVGESKDIEYVLKPSNSTDKYLTFISSDPSVAIVEEGKITALKEGNCDITIKSVNGKSAKLFVEVKEKAEIENIKFNEKSIVLKENDIYSLNPVVEPNSIKDKSLTFTSSNESVAKIESSDGETAIIRALKEGSTTITVKAKNGVKNTIKVSVSNKNSSDVSKNEGTIEVRINDTITPAKVYSKDIAYTNPANITITKHGSVDTIKYCYAPYVNAICTPNLIYSESFKIPSGNLYRLRIQKFDSKGREIVGSNADNYKNGALEYYINTKSDSIYKDVGYVMNGNYYTTITEANKNIQDTRARISFSFINTVTDELRICYTNGISCDPDRNSNVIIKNNSIRKYIDINEKGLWKIYVSEYSNGGKVGKTKIYYVKLSENDIKYTMTGNYYFTVYEAENNSVSGSQRINFEVKNGIDKLKICFTDKLTCDPENNPDKIITSSTITNYIDISDHGAWKIFVNQYKNDLQIGNSDTYYLNIK